jgi:hypothetical protein
MSDRLQFVVDFPDGLISRRHDKLKEALNKSVLRVGSTAKRLGTNSPGLPRFVATLGRSREG